MNLYLCLGMQAFFTALQFLADPFTPNLTVAQHMGINGAIGACQAALATIQHMTGQVSISQPTPVSLPKPQDPPKAP